MAIACKQLEMHQGTGDAQFHGAEFLKLDSSIGSKGIFNMEIC